MREGVRALPSRATDGSIPYAGKLGAADNVWVVGGLGARGLVYHAWLGKLVAAGLLSTGDAHLPAELRRWQQQHPADR